MHPELPVKLLTKSASVPTYGSEEAAGMDLYADFGSMRGDAAEPHGHPLFAENDFLHLEPGQHRMVGTGIAVSIPPGFYGRIAPRSGLAARNGIDVLAGVVDRDYRGELKVILINLGHDVYTISHGDRIAQMIIEPCERVAVQEVEELDSTARGAARFGSTGK